jgi:NAD(P)-dependent dehydrogenase (short-subunit alcohol dehydrogenase family)
MRLEGHVAIVTGLSHAGQVGYALTAAFAREGAHLAISARGAKRMHARAEELRGAGAKVIAVPADLTTEEGANMLVAFVALATLLSSPSTILSVPIFLAALLLVRGLPALL